jgi:predicted DNA-binding protein YlxM (UPF0122 family)
MEYKKQLKAWAKRRVRMVELFKNNVSLGEIAKINGISKQRVLQILKEEEERKLTRA